MNHRVDMAAVCHPDGLSVAEVTTRVVVTWDREPLFHLFSPLEGWKGPKPARHRDDIDPADLPAEWLGLDLTVDVEARAKALAVKTLRVHLDADRITS